MPEVGAMDADGLPVIETYAQELSTHAIDERTGEKAGFTQQTQSKGP